MVYLKWGIGWKILFMFGQATILEIFDLKGGQFLSGGNAGGVFESLIYVIYDGFYTNAAFLNETNHSFKWKTKFVFSFHKFSNVTEVTFWLSIFWCIFQSFTLKNEIGIFFYKTAPIILQTKI